MQVAHRLLRAAVVEHRSERALAARAAVHDGLERLESRVLGEEGQKHYTKGGKVGYFPSFDVLPHPVPFNLYDPFGRSKDRTPEEKERGLLVEINNGRLAMIGLMGFLAEGKVPGSVPALAGLIKPYSGQVMSSSHQVVIK